MVINPNYIFIGGRPVRDPQIFANNSDGNSENKCAVFTLAVNRIGRDGEQQADYISCRCYGKNAETCEKYIKRGTNIQCHGAFRSYLVEKEDGKKINQIYLLVDRIFFGENKKTEDGQENQNSGTGSNNPYYNNPRTNDQQMVPQNNQSYPQNENTMNRPQQNRPQANPQGQQGGQAMNRPQQNRPQANPQGQQGGQTMNRPQQNRPQANPQGQQGGQTMNRPQQNRPQNDPRGQQGGQTMNRPQQNRPQTNPREQQNGQSMNHSQQNRHQTNQNSQQQNAQATSRPQQNQPQYDQNEQFMQGQSLFGAPGMPMMSGTPEDYFDDFLNIPDGIEEELPLH